MDADGHALEDPNGMHNNEMTDGLKSASGMFRDMRLPDCLRIGHETCAVFP